MDPGPRDLRDYLSILKVRRWTVLAIVVTTSAVALAYSFRQHPVYTSSAEVVVLPTSFGPTVSSGASTPINMKTEEQIADSVRVAELASANLAARQLVPGTTSVSAVEDADTLEFSSVSPDPGTAQATANEYVAAYLELRRSDFLNVLEAARKPYETQIQDIDAELQKIAHDLPTAPVGEREVLSARYSFLLSERVSAVTSLNGLASPEAVEVGQVLRSADLPHSPSGPLHGRDVLLALALGLALGIAVALFRDRFDERIRGREELELSSGAPVLAFIPRVRLKRDEPPITLSRPESEAAQAFNALRVRLLHAVDQRSTKSILVTSSLSGEGKTSVVANLGVVLALAGKRVVMVSADLRKARLETYFRGSGSEGQRVVGLIDVLSREKQPLEALSSTGINNLWVLRTGTLAPSLSPSGILGSESMKHLLAELGDFADLVLVDSPPLLASSDVVVLAPLTDGALLVVDPRHVRRSNIEQARREFELIGVPVIGVVVNQLDPNRFRAYGSSYSHYGVREQSGAPSSANGFGSPDPSNEPGVPNDRDLGQLSSP